MIDLTTTPTVELQATLDAIKTEQKRRERVASHIGLIVQSADALRAEGEQLAEVTITTSTATPEQGWLPGQIVRQGGKFYRQTLPTPTELRPGGTIRPWEEYTPPPPEPTPEPELGSEGGDGEAEA